MTYNALQSEEGAGAAPARLPLQDLTSLWFQVTGLLCNLRCSHCLVDSSPDNDSMAFLDPDTVSRYLAEAETLGVKEVYFTGGEPFLHRRMVDMLAEALRVAPTTVLTNGTLITERLARELGAAAAGSPYSLEIRVSIDHPDAATNDAVRGAGSYAKAVRAVLRLQEQGLLPIVTATEYVYERDGASLQGTYDAFRSSLLEAGVARPRLKILPVFRTGKLEDPGAGGPVTETMMEGFDPLLLQCASARAVTAQGLYACPILVGQEQARVGGQTLASAAEPVVLSHHACRTCYDTGMTCGNF